MTNEFTGACHCGRVRWQITASPAWLTECNCSICRRNAALWGHVQTNQVVITGEAHSHAYIWGDKMLAIHSCKTCGCTTHWRNLDPSPNARMAVNFRMSSAQTRSLFRHRRLDGADT